MTASFGQMVDDLLAFFTTHGDDAYRRLVTTRSTGS